MSPRLVGPEAAVSAAIDRVAGAAADLAVLARTGKSPLVTVVLRPGIQTYADAERNDPGRWYEWISAWRATNLDEFEGITIDADEVSVRGVPTPSPRYLSIASVAGLNALLEGHGHMTVVAQIERLLRICELLTSAHVNVTSSTLRSVSRITDDEIQILVEAILWFGEHPDIGRWSARQVPVPRMDSKWLSRRGALLKKLIGRDVVAELRPRPAVVHVTYLDPAYRRTGGRVHDAWTTGDAHSLAYQPKNVIVVENRESRVWFPEMEHTIAIEGEGKAAATLTGSIEWLLSAENIFYWGDIDSDGFAILDRFRAEIESHGREVHSILMDRSAFAKYHHLGTDTDQRGMKLKPSSSILKMLTPDENACYSAIATAGEVEVRRIEQERIPLEEAAQELRRMLAIVELNVE